MSMKKKQVLEIFKGALLEGHIQYSSAFLFILLIKQVFSDDELLRVTPTIELLTVGKIGARSNAWARFYVKYGYLDQQEVDDHIFKICDKMNLVAKINDFLKLIISIDCKEMFENGEIKKLSNR